MFDIYQSTVLITAIFFTGFGGFAIWNNRKDISVRLFALLSLAFAIWSYSWFGLLSISSDTGSALFFARMLNFGATFIPVFFLHWVFVTLSIQKKARKFILIAYAITIFFAIFSFSDLYISGVKSISIFPYWPIAGSLYFIFILIGYVGFISVGLVFLIGGFLKEKDEIRKKIAFLFIGSFLGFIGGGMNFPLMFGFVIPQPYDLIGVFMLMASPFMFSYAAVQYKLFDIKNVAIQLFSGALNIVFVINVLLAKTFYSIFISSLLLIFTLWFTILLVNILKREVSQREKIEFLADNLKQANTRLTDLDKQKSEFISFASHQLRAPLTAMKGYASLILDGDMGTLNNEVKQAIGRIFDSSKTLTNIVDDYLNISRIELGTMKYVFEVQDLKKLVDNVLGELKPNIEKTGLKFEYSTNPRNPDERFMVSADTDKLKQVIANLVDNSTKYTPSGGLSINLSKNTENRKILFSVRDTGVGISAEVMPKLFAKFVRATNANKQNIYGTGLGLFIAKEIVTAHKGRIWAESDGEGKGSTFFLELDMAV
jgi:signal transduction histidine kinase